MHESALSESVISTALDACKGGEGRITAIGVGVGTLSAANVDSLRFWMELMLKNKGMENTEVDIISVPARAECECGNVYEAQDMVSACPRCGSFTREVISGMDVTVRWIEVEDEENNED